jgi:hypothetical protein
MGLMAAFLYDPVTKAPNRLIPGPHKAIFQVPTPDETDEQAQAQNFIVCPKLRVIEIDGLQHVQAFLHLLLARQHAGYPITKLYVVSRSNDNNHLTTLQALSQFRAKHHPQLQIFKVDPNFVSVEEYAIMV